MATECVIGVVLNNWEISLNRLASALGVKDYHVADRGMVPRKLVVSAADRLGVAYNSNSTAEDIVDEIFHSSLVVDIPRSFESRVSRLSDLVEESDELVEESAKVDRDKPVLTKTIPGRLASEGSYYEPPRSKLEAVNRISALTNSGPETLGPGSKERKTVLINLARRLSSNAPVDSSKPELAKWIIEWLGGEWNDAEDISTGYTIKRTVLDRILRLATRYFSEVKGGLALTVESEAGAYLEVVASSLDCLDEKGNWSPSPIDGRSAVEEMIASEFSNSFQTEWFGFYTEFRALNALQSAYGGGPERVGTTAFDYRGKRLWDLKTHMVGRNDVLLNDKASMTEAIGREGLGFLVVNAVPDFTAEDQFYRWHLEKRGRKLSEPRKANSRKLKVASTVTSLEAYYFENSRAEVEAANLGILTDFAQGKQQDGSPRKVKYKMNLQRAASSRFLVASLPQEH